MDKKYKISLTFIIILILICLSLLIFKIFFLKNAENKKPTVYSLVVDTMDNYGYTLDNKDTKLFKEKYYELKDILNSDNIDYELYAQKLAELFVIDVFTISNKVNKYDVGGLDFLYDEEREMFKNKIIDTLYDHVEDNSYNTRKQNLPQVKSTNILNCNFTKYTINDKSLDSYEVNLEISYEKDMGYDTNAKITIAKDGNKMYIVKYTTSN